MIIRSLVTGSMGVNTYVVTSDQAGEALIIDPGGSEEQILKLVDELHLKVKAILLTHGHADHIAGVERLVRQAKWQVWIHAGDAEMLTNPSLNLSVWIGAPIQLPPADRLLADGDTIWLDNILLTVRHTPGIRGVGSVWSGPIWSSPAIPSFAGAWADGFSRWQHE